MSDWTFTGYGFSVNQLLEDGDTEINLPMEAIRKACGKSDALAKFMLFNNVNVFGDEPLNTKALKPIHEEGCFFDGSMCEDALSYILLLVLNSLCKERYNQEFFFHAPGWNDSYPDGKENFILFKMGYPWELPKRFPTSMQEVDGLIMTGIRQILGNVGEVEIESQNVVYG